VLCCKLLPMLQINAYILILLVVKLSPMEFALSAFLPIMP
jgi:hypothetical protein